MSLHEINDEFRNDPLYLLVENTIFSVNRTNFVKDSEFFRELFELPQQKDVPTEGASVEHPLLVEGVKKDDFVLLLKAMYPQYIGDSSTISCDEWIAVLKLLALWQFNIGKHRVLAILRDSADAITKISLYEDLGLDVEEWLVPAVSELARRGHPLTETEAERLGVKNTVRVFRVRESYTCAGCKRGGPGKNAPAGQTRAEHDFAARIRYVFHVRANVNASASATVSASN